MSLFLSQSSLNFWTCNWVKHQQNRGQKIYSWHYIGYKTIDCVFLSCHIRVSSESTLYNCLNVKEFLARNRRDIWKLSDYNGTRTHNHLVCKRAQHHLTKLLTDDWVFAYKLSACGFESHRGHLKKTTAVSFVEH